jgi:hypothetical protein
MAIGSGGAILYSQKHRRRRLGPATHLFPGRIADGVKAWMPGTSLGNGRFGGKFRGKPSQNLPLNFPRTLRERGEGAAREALAVRRRGSSGEI